MRFDVINMDATEMLQIRLDNANLRKDIIHVKGKLSESMKELSEVKLRHVFEMDEIKLTYEDKMENLQKLNSNLQLNVDKYQNKVLALHELMKEKDDIVSEMKRKLQDSHNNINVQKNDYIKRIQSLQNDVKILQSENNKLKKQRQDVELSNVKLSDSFKKLEAEHAQCIERTPEHTIPASCSNIINSLEMSDHQLQTELNELHTLLKEKSKTIREIKKKRTGSWNQYKDIDKKGYSYKMNSLENEIKSVQLENNHLKNYCNEIENSKALLVDKIKMLESNLINEEKQRKEMEDLNNLVKEKEDTITWIETKMLESFDSMAIKTNEYEEKITTLENEIKALQTELHQEIKIKEFGDMTMVACNENVDEILLKPIDVAGGLDVLSACPNSIDIHAPDTPSKLGRRGGLKRIFSKSFRKFIRDRGHVKDRGISDDNEMFYVSEKDEN